MKKIISVFLSLAILVLMSACKEKDDKSNTSDFFKDEVTLHDNSDEKTNNSEEKNNSSSGNTSTNENNTASNGNSSNKTPSGNANNGNSSVNPTLTYNSEIKIDSLDKLNFYSVKKAIQENNVTLLSSTVTNNKVQLLSNVNNNGILNLAASYTDINLNTNFTITMYSYFTIKLNNKNGFLARKLGGTGEVEVVITKNNFENMITFRKGDKYYTCLQHRGTEKALSFSTHKYVEGFKMVENYDRENYEFTVYFEGDKVVGINSGRFLNDSPNCTYEVDDITMIENFCIVIHKTKSFTAKQLESLFASNNTDSNQGVVLNDGSIVYGESVITNNAVAFKDSKSNTVLANGDVSRIYARYSTNKGYFIELKLTSNGNSKFSSALNGGSGELSFYLNNSLVNKVKMQRDSATGNACIVNLSTKTDMSYLFNKLATPDNSYKIGKIITHQQFATEIGKRIDLSKYNVSSTTADKRTYTLKNNKSIGDMSSIDEVTIDGITFTMPIKISELESKGFEIVRRQGYIDSIKTKSGNEVYVYDVGQYITELLFMCYDTSTNYQEGICETCPSFSFMGGINNNSTLDDIITKLGEPNKIIFLSKYVSYSNCTMNDMQLYYSLATPKYPDAELVLNVLPVTNSNTPTDFLFTASISFHNKNGTIG